MSLLTEQELLDAFDTIPDYEYDGFISYGRAVEQAVLEKIKAQGLVAFEYNGEPWFDGNNWHEQKELTKDRKVAEFKAYLGKPPVPLYRLPEGD